MRAAALCICLATGLAGCAAFGNPRLFESPADAKISAEVRTLLRQSNGLGTPNVISVQTHGGVVYLRGLMSTPYQIEEAGSLAEQAAGVSRVENMLTLDNAH